MDTEILFKEINTLTKPELRESILSFESELLKLPGAILGDSERCPLKHSFSGNLYIREIFLPKGTLLTGKIHRHSHPNFLMSGEVTVVTEDGGIEHLKAPLSMISKPATKRAIYAHEDTVWITIHEVGDERDLKKIEEIVIAPSYADLDKQISDEFQIKLLDDAITEDL